MSTRASFSGSFAGLCLLIVAAVTAAGSGTARAGDEDLSPNAYQEFDPVTGFMVPVDPDATAGHGDDTAAQADSTGINPTDDVQEDKQAGSKAWLYWVIVGVAAVGVVAWLRKKAAALGD